MRNEKRTCLWWTSCVLIYTNSGYQKSSSGETVFRAWAVSEDHLKLTFHTSSVDSLASSMSEASGTYSDDLVFGILCKIAHLVVNIGLDGSGVP